MMDVIKFWEALRTKAGDPRSWDMLHPQEQQMVIQSINLLLAVLHNNNVNKGE
jgi:hypothetical protein